MPITSQQATALMLHRALDDVFVPGFSGRFASGYDTEHPFADLYLQALCRDDISTSLGSYRFAQEERLLIEAIRHFHLCADGHDYAPTEILISAGSSPLLLALMLLLRERQVRSILYYAPVYHSCYYFADLTGIEMACLGRNPLWDEQSIPIFPDQEHTLFIADPIWIAGKPVSANAIEAVRAWQQRTGSLVIVDGTFQYMHWDGLRQHERSTCLDRKHTIRLICPSKALAVHGIRFAYLLGPDPLLREMRWICDNITGSASELDLRAAIAIMQALSSHNGNRQLIDYVRTRYWLLSDAGVVYEPIRQPECGYYMFGKLKQHGEQDIVMDGRYFELECGAEFVRINLLSPDLSAPTMDGLRSAIVRGRDRQSTPPTTRLALSDRPARYTREQPSS